MGLSIITSLYRSDHHIKTYADQAKAFDAKLRAADIAVQWVLVVNDATSLEKQIINDLQSSLDVDALFVPRETLYTSWNRGLQVTKYETVGFWNVDDVRLIDGVITACKTIRNGAELVDMPYIARYTNTGKEVRGLPFRPQSISPKTIMTMFALFHRDLFHKAGEFNPNFKIAGDFEWCTREVVRNAKYVQLDALGGYFQIHDGNLSNGTSPLEWVEINTVLLWRGVDDVIRPVDPDLMRTTWESWGYTGRPNLPDSIKTWLWGDGAQDRYQAYLKERNQPQWIRRIRLGLARRGLISSVEWDAHNQNN